jgi:hypothetical protein
MKDIMLDIETMGTGPCAALVQVGAMRFDLETGQCAPQTLLIDVALQSSLAVGAVETIATREWWAARGGFLHASSPVSVGDMFGQLHGWVREGGEVVRVWAKGPHFDIAILEFHALALGGRLPWEYYQVRDVRTIVELARFTGWRHGAGSGPTHRADQDCEVQVANVLSAYKALSRV